MFNSAFIWFGIVVIIFIISVSLLIFAPKSINYYIDETYPILKYISDNNIQSIKDEFYSIKNNDEWLSWPTDVDVTGECKIYPLYMFSVQCKKRTDMCVKTYQLVSNMPDVKSFAFIKIAPNSQINKNRQWKELSNTTLRCLLILESEDDDMVNECAIWVNGETKKIKTNKLIIFDSSKEHAIFNKTKMPINALMLDIKRPEKISSGASMREYDDEMKEFIYNLAKDNLSNS